jgi:hypothetical protein
MKMKMLSKCSISPAKRKMFIDMFGTGLRAANSDPLWFAESASAHANRTAQTAAGETEARPMEGRKKLRGRLREIEPKMLSYTARARGTSPSHSHPTFPLFPASMASRIGLIGLAVMGQNLALNIAEKGFTISVWNRSTDKTDQTVARAAKENISGLTGAAGVCIHGICVLFD